jgi:hypothetical protein
MAEKLKINRIKAVLAEKAIMRIWRQWLGKRLAPLQGYVIMIFNQHSSYLEI